MKRDDIDYCIALLVQWHRCSNAGELATLGYPPECPSTRGYQASRQYDDVNGAQESSERSWIVRRVGHILDGMERTHRIALQVLARNRSTGVSVWRSPALPVDDDERAEFVAEALALFLEQV